MGLGFMAFCSAALSASVSGSNTGNVAIPDATASGPGAYVSSTIVISGAPAGALVTGIDVYFKCVHAYGTDLTVDLNADSTGSLGNYRLWSQAAGANPTKTTTGISTFNGLSVNRTWYLYARDWVQYDTGYIDEWTITIYYASATPTISSVSPNPVTGANSTQSLTVYGSGFASGAQVKLAWPAVGVVPAGNTTFSATFVSSSQLQVNGITFANDPGTWTAQVINPGPVSSSTYSFNVQAPFPGITSISPSSATAGGAAFNMTVNGATFHQGSVVRWNGGNLTTTPTVSSGGLTTALTAQVPASAIASAGTATVTVYSPGPGGGTSSGVTFTINPGGPTISSVSPSPVTGANSGQSLTVYGSGFVSGAQVKLAWPAVGVVSAGNTTFSATFVSNSQLQVNGITFANDPGTWTAQVINPGPVSSSTYSFNVQAPFPVITSISPSSATAGGAGFNMTVNGVTFHQGSVVRWNGANLTTTPTVSAGGLTTALTAQVPVGTIASVGTASVTVYSPGPGGGLSSGVTFTINPGGPTITSVSPAPVTGSSSAQTFTVYGSGFVSGAQVKLAWPAVGVSSAGSANFTASFISSSQLQITATFGTDASTWTAQVINPGNVTSSTYSFSVQAPPPVITSLSPSSASAGSAAFNMTVNGSTFSQSSIVRWNAANLTTTPTVSGGGLVQYLTAQVPANYIASAGTATITVYTPTPGGGTSSGATFTINPTGPTITSVSPNPVTGSNVQQPFTINGNNFASGCNVTLRDLSTSEVFPNRTVSSFTSTRIVINPNFTTAAHNWSVEVINPGGATSGQFNFTVAAPGATPTITGVSPNPVTGSSTSQPFTIIGNNFLSGASVTLRDLTTSDVFPNRTIGSLTSGQIVINPIFTTAAHNWSVEVINPGNASSGQYNFAVVAPGGGLYLSFPLANRTPYTATVNSVFDHASQSGVVIAFTGERGDVQYGQLSPTDPSFKQASGGNFSVNGNYSGGGYPNYLSYDGHQGFDYRTRDADQDPANGRVNVLAAAPGVLHWIAGSAYNTIEIDHGGGYTTRYLHLYSRQAGLDGATVTRSQVIGISGDTGAPGSPHLHFEARLNGVAVDPYGWAGSGADPYTAAVSVNLWNSTPACTYLISPVSHSHGPAADAATFSVTAGSGCSWTATANAPWITITSGTSGSGSGSVSYSVSANTTTSVRTGSITVQGTVFAVTQTGVIAGDRVYGVDVSSIGQGTITPSQWAQVKSAGKSFAWIRSSKGNADSDGNCRFLDPKFYDNINAAKNAGLLVGAYHVGNVVQYSALEEAAFFVSVAGNFIKPGNLRPALDLESHSCGDPATLGPSALAAWVDQWASEVQRLTGVTPLIYCNQAFLPNLQSSLAQKYDLWVAKFTENPESALSVAPWTDWTTFQYSQSGSVGGISPIDLSVFRGTLQQLQTRLVIPMPQITGIGGGGIQPPSNGQFQCEVSAPSQQQVTVQACDDLLSWADVSTLIIVNGKATFTDPNAGAHQKRFYRPKP